MNWKQYSEIQRQLGYIEGLTMGVKEEIGADLTEAVDVLSNMIENIPIDELQLAQEVRYEQQKTGNGF